MKGRRTPPRITPDDAARLMTEQPGLYILHVAHDDWCQTLRTGNGLDCNCSPETTLERYQEPKGGRQ